MAVKRSGSRRHASARGGAPVPHPATSENALTELDRTRRQAEHARHEWTAVFDAIRDPVFLHDRDGRIVRANRAYAMRAGLAFEQILGRYYWEVFPHRTGPLDSCAHEWQPGEELRDEEIVLNSGEVLVSRAFAVPGPDGEAHYSVHVFEDVTEKRHAEADQRMRGAALHQAVEAVVVSNRERCVTYVNPAFQTLWGYTPDEVLGQPVEAVLGISAGGGDAPAEATDLGAREVTLRAKDGTEVPVYFSNVAVQDDRGDIAGYLATFLDLRPIRRAERLLRENEARYRALTEGSADMASIIGVDGTSIYLSPSVEWVLGYTPKELRGTSVFDRIHPDDIGAVRAAMVAVMAVPGAQQTVELRYHHKNGEWRYVESRGRYLPDITAGGGIVINSRDITDRKRAELSLTRVNRALKTLSECNQALVRFDDELALYHEICQLIVNVGGYRLAWVVARVDGAVAPAVVVSQVHADAPFTDLAPVAGSEDPAGRHPALRALRERVPRIVADVRTDPEFQAWRDDAVQRGVVALVALPLLDRDTAIGALCIGSAETDVFDADEMDLLQKLAADLAHGIAAVRDRSARDQALRERQQAQDSLRASLISAIGAIGATLEMRDPYTAGHQRRVAELAVAIARELGLPDSQIEGIHFGALIHDIGKIQVPGEILSKPGKLTAIEYELIKNHPQAGYEILRNVQFPWPIAQMVLQHHERLDGSGYPAGLAGAEILREARILCVADVVEAISSHRPYRPTLGIERALAEVQEHRGTHYDPEVVDACLALFESKRFVFSG
jgi:PAS domain S-box-containing protein/putative nucleotidyltransferase with HDIG domain